jgi:hypothetical protein
MMGTFFEKNVEFSDGYLFNDSLMQQNLNTICALFVTQCLRFLTMFVLEASLNTLYPTGGIEFRDWIGFLT